jgi:hypothetical protein
MSQDLQRAYQALEAAHAANDKAGAAELAALIRQMEAQGSQAAPAAPRTDLIAGVQHGYHSARLNAAQHALDSKAAQGEVSPYVNRALSIGKDPKQAQADVTAYAAQDRGALEQTVAEQQKALADLNYQPAKLSDVKGVGSALGFAARSAAESAPLMAAGIASGGVALLPMAVDEVNAGLREIEGLDPKTREGLAASGGLVIAALDKLGLSAIMKGVPKPLIAKWGASGVARYLSGKGIVPAVANRVANTAFAGASEAVTEGAQEGVQIGAEATAGKEFQPGEVTQRLTEATVKGGAAGGAVRGSMDVAGATVDTAKATRNVIQDTRSNLEYSQNPDQVASDVRVGRLYEQARDSIQQFDSGTEPTNDVVFKKVQDSLKQKLYDGIDGLYRNGDITKDARDELTRDADNVLKQAGQHNRDLSEGDVEKIRRLGLEPAVEKGLVNAFRDLNTATFSGMKKNMSGPFERIGKAAGPAITAAMGVGGYAHGGPATGLLGGLAAGGVRSGVQSAGRSVDRMLGLQDPTVLRRYQSRARALEGKGVNVGDTANFLDDLRANVQAGAQIGHSPEAELGRQAASARAQLRLANQVPGGGWEAYVAQQTGLDPAQQDVVLMSLMARGKLNAQQHRAFLKNPHTLQSGNQGNAMIDLMNAEASRMGITPAVAPAASARPDAPTSENVSGIRNPMAYAQTMRNVEAATRNANETAPTPELRAAVGEVANARTQADKRTRVEQMLAQNPQHADWINSVVAPLASFGPEAQPRVRPEGAPISLSNAPEGLAPLTPGTRRRTVEGFPQRRPTRQGADGNLEAKSNAILAAIGRKIDKDHGVVTGEDIEFVSKEVEAYKQAAGIKKKSLPKGGFQMPEGFLYKVADWMDQAKHSPNDPAVKQAYSALAHETKAQFDHLIKIGNVKFEAWDGKGEPYRNSAEMLKDVRENGHLWFFRTENGFGEKAAAERHPLLEETQWRDQKGRPLVVNDLFRIVHDYYGHSQNRFMFGEKGEYNAFHEHARMFSDEAIPALAAETLAQNAWVNFGPHLRNAEGKVPGPGEPGFKPRPERPFSEQKTIAVPKGLLMEDPSNDDPAAVARRAIAANAVKLSKGEKSATSIPVLYEGAKPETFDTILDYAHAMDAKWKKENGEPLTKYDDATRKRVAKTIVAEALHAIQKDGNAVTWYRDKTQGAHAIVSLLHPEIADDPIRSTAFNFALAVTSNGMTIAQNAKLAEQVYSKYKGSNAGHMPIFGEGDRAAQMKKAFKLWNKLVDEMGQEKLVQFLSEERTVRELNEAGFKVSKELKDTVLPVSVIFGPKIGGGFFQNLQGNFSPLTMDRWFMRTWGRLTGKLWAEPSAKTTAEREARVRASLTPDILSDYGFEGVDPQTASSEKLMEIAETIWEDDRNRGFPKDDTTRERPEHKVAAQRLAEGPRKTLDAPANGKHRKFIRETVQEALTALRGMGIDIDAADLQALVWYPEKDLLKAHGIGDKRSAPTDYETEFFKIAKERGIDEETIEAAIQARTGRRGSSPRQVDGILDGRGDDAAGESGEAFDDEGGDEDIPF